MSHTYWPPKGIMKRRPGGYTYYGGNTNLSAQYKDRYIPHYDPETTMSKVDRTDEISVLQKSEKWNTYQKRMWYQDDLDHTTPEFEEFPGLHAEWRKEGEFEKSYRKYNSKFVYDFRVNVTTTDADGVVSTEQMRTADHTEIQKLRHVVDEQERFDIDIDHSNNRKTVNFSTNCNDANSSRNFEEEAYLEDRKFGRQPNRSRVNPNNYDVDDDIQYFNQDDDEDISRPGSRNTPSKHHPSSSSSSSSSSRKTRPSSAPSAARRHNRVKHPAINPSLCREHPKETFRKKEQFPLFWSKPQKEDFRQHRSSSNLLNTTSGRMAHDTCGLKST
jgi:hypothetical protein